MAFLASQGWLRFIEGPTAKKWEKQLKKNEEKSGKPSTTRKYLSPDCY